jgi:hypothetical protein
MIKIGSSRLVILIGKWAIKIPFNKCGIEQSYQEIKTWDKYKTFPFNKILFKFKFITVHRRAEKINKYEFKYLRQYIKVLESKYPELQFEYGDIYRFENWGRVNHRLVIIDYGLTEEIEGKYYKNGITD